MVLCKVFRLAQSIFLEPIHFQSPLSTQRLRSFREHVRGNRLMCHLYCRHHHRRWSSAWHRPQSKFHSIDSTHSLRFAQFHLLNVFVGQTMVRFFQILLDNMPVSHWINSLIFNFIENDAIDYRLTSFATGSYSCLEHKKIWFRNFECIETGLQLIATSQFIQFRENVRINWTSVEQNQTYC